MIEARRNKLFEGIFLAYTEHILRKQFHGVHVGGLENFGQLNRTLPIILCCNHSSWWDGMIAFFLSQHVLHVEPYAMMEEKHMRRYGFFRWIGAFSVERESPRSAVASMRYAASLFTRPNVVVWIYPQGVMLPNDVRPLRLYQGVARVSAMLGRVQIVPVAHKYEFLMEQRPEAFTLIGEPWIPEESRNAESLTDELASRLTGVLDTLRCAVATKDVHGFTTVLTGRPSTNVLFDRLRLRQRTV